MVWITENYCILEEQEVAELTCDHCGQPYTTLRFLVGGATGRRPSAAEDKAKRTLERERAKQRPLCARCTHCGKFPSQQVKLIQQRPQRGALWGVDNDITSVVGGILLAAGFLVIVFGVHLAISEFPRAPVPALIGGGVFEALGGGVGFGGLKLLQGSMYCDFLNFRGALRGLRRVGFFLAVLLACAGLLAWTVDAIPQAMALFLFSVFCLAGPLFAEKALTRPEVMNSEKLSQWFLHGVDGKAQEVGEKLGTAAGLEVDACLRRAGSLLTSPGVCSTLVPPILQMMGEASGATSEDGEQNDLSQGPRGLGVKLMPFFRRQAPILGLFFERPQPPGPEWSWDRQIDVDSYVRWWLREGQSRWGLAREACGPREATNREGSDNYHNLTSSM